VWRLWLLWGMGGSLLFAELFGRGGGKDQQSGVGGHEIEGVAKGMFLGPSQWVTMADLEFLDSVVGEGCVRRCRGGSVEWAEVSWEQSGRGETQRTECEWDVLWTVRV